VEGRSDKREDHIKEKIRELKKRIKEYEETMIKIEFRIEEIEK